MAGPADTLRSLWSRVARKAGDTVDELFLDSYREQLDLAREQAIGGDPAGAVETLEALLRERPDHAGALALLGEIELVRGKDEHAAAAFARALALRSGDAQALIGRGRALVALGQLAAAVELLGRGVDAAGGDRALLAAAYLALGQAWRGLGEPDKAVRDLRKAVAEAPDDALARALLGEVLLADPRTSADEARGHLERAAASEPPPAIALLALGRLALGEQRALDAARMFGLAVDAALAGSGPEARRQLIAARLGLGDAALAQRDHAGAHQRYLEALELDPRRADVHARLAGLAAALGDTHAALTAYDRALALGADVATLAAAVTAAHVGGDRARAVRWANDLLAAQPGATIALAARAEDLRAQGQAVAARALLVGAPPDVEVRLTDSRAAADLGEHDAAIAAARAALALAPSSGRARTALADALARALAVPDDDDLPRLADALTRVLARRADLAGLVAAVGRALAELEQPLLVTVMGEFSSGKSSFVNAFIGDEVAATGITPTTATINVVKYGHERGGRLIAPDGGGRALPWDELHAALRALTPDDARAIDRVEITLPLDALAKVHIIDTPGLNSILPEHEATARAFIARADAVVWVFTAGQGGKASEKKALDAIRAEGKRVLGVLNKRDQLLPREIAEVVEYVGSQLGDRVEHIVPFSARGALAWKRAGGSGDDDGGWRALAAALEERFFAQARAIKRAAVARRLTGTIAAARATLDTARADALARADAERTVGERVASAAAAWADAVVDRERRALATAVGELYRRAAHEVIELVRPRQLPFGSHSATAADRDYLVALLADGYEAMLRAAADRVAADLRAAIPVAAQAHERAVATATAPLAYARAYVAGYLAGGAVDGFFKHDLPRLALEPETVHHALYRAAPDLENIVVDPLTRAGQRALAEAGAASAQVVAHHELEAFELDVGLERALGEIAARVAR
jgi:tetratricopeptide (TPR) repeat protein/GTPase SAR1 family protein